MCSKRWLTSKLMVFYKLLGCITFAVLWLKTMPKVKLCNPLGNVTPSMFWLKPKQSVMFSEHGECITFAMLLFEIKANK